MTKYICTNFQIIWLIIAVTIFKNHQKRCIFGSRRRVSGSKVPENCLKSTKFNNESCGACAQVHLYQISSYLVHPCSCTTKNCFFEISKYGSKSVFWLFQPPEAENDPDTENTKDPDLWKDFFVFYDIESFLASGGWKSQKTDFDPFLEISKNQFFVLQLQGRTKRLQIWYKYTWVHPPQDSLMTFVDLRQFSGTFEPETLFREPKMCHFWWFLKIVTARINQITCKLVQMYFVTFLTIFINDSFQFKTISRYFWAKNWFSRSKNGWPSYIHSLAVASFLDRSLKSWCQIKDIFMNFPDF